ncbi:MAG: hypothetical protein ACK52H_15335, partial [Burkholderiales bacterium]
ALLVQPNDLLAPLVQLLQCLVSCVFFFHDLNMGSITWNSRLQWAESIDIGVLCPKEFFDIYPGTSRSSLFIIRGVARIHES